MKTLVLLTALLIGCGSDPSNDSSAPEETGGSATTMALTEATGGNGATLTTGGSSAMLSATGGQTTQATGGHASTGGQAGTGGSSVCVPLTCREMGPKMSGLSSSLATYTVSDSCGTAVLSCHCQLTQNADSTWVGYCL